MDKAERKAIIAELARRLKISPDEVLRLFRRTVIKRSQEDAHPKEENHGTADKP